MEEAAVKNKATLQENFVSKLYSLNQKIWDLKLDLTLKNQRMLQEWFIKSVVMTVKNIYKGNWSQVKRKSQRT